MAEEEKQVNNERVKWVPLGDNQDDPQIERIYHEEEKCAAEIKRSGFGSLGTSLNPIKK